MLPTQVEPVEPVDEQGAGHLPAKLLPAVGQGLRRQRLPVDAQRDVLRRRAGIDKGVGPKLHTVGLLRVDLAQRDEEPALRARRPDGALFVGRVDLGRVPALAAIGIGAGLAQVEIELVAARGLAHAVGLDAVLCPEGRLLQRQRVFHEVPRGLPRVLIGRAAGDGREEQHVARVVEIHEVFGLHGGGFQHFGRHGPAKFDLGERLEIGDALEIFHLELGRTADVAAQHGLAMRALVVLQLRLLGAEDAEAVAPAQRHLHHAEVARRRRDLVVDGGHPCVGEGQRQGRVLEDHGGGQQHCQRRAQPCRPCGAIACAQPRHQPVDAITGQHRQPQHENDAVAVRCAVGLDHRDEVQQGKGQRHRRLQPVEVEAIAPVDLQQRPQRQHAKNDARPDPHRDLAPVNKRADQRQRQRHPAQEDGVDVAEAGQLRVGRPLLHQAQLLDDVAAEERVKDRRREPAAQVRAEHERIAPALQVVVGGEERAQDRDQRRRPEGEGDEGEDEEVQQRGADGRRLGDWEIGRLEIGVSL